MDPEQNQVITIYTADGRAHQVMATPRSFAAFLRANAVMASFRTRLPAVDADGLTTGPPSQTEILILRNHITAVTTPAGFLDGVL